MSPIKTIVFAILFSMVYMRLLVETSGLPMWLSLPTGFVGSMVLGKLLGNSDPFKKNS